MVTDTYVPWGDRIASAVREAVCPRLGGDVFVRLPKAHNFTDVWGCLTKRHSTAVAAGNFQAWDTSLTCVAVGFSSGPSLLPVQRTHQILTA